ncbi:MAG: hypothetical protein C0594_12060, partial [Marinilabiliales bacterium]
MNSCKNEIDIQLTNEEKQWLSQQDSIIFVPYKAYPPMDFLDTDNIQKGISMDILKLIEEAIDYNFTLHYAGNWDEMVNFVKNNKN